MALWWAELLRVVRVRVLVRVRVRVRVEVHVWKAVRVPRVGSEVRAALRLRTVHGEVHLGHHRRQHDTRPVFKA
jgi:hypothetical protein